MTQRAGTGNSDRGATDLPFDSPPDDSTRGRILALERFLPYRLSMLATVVGRALAHPYEVEHDLTAGEWRLIAILARFGPLSANAVCERSAMDKVRVSRAVSRTTSRGLVHRAIDSEDRRRSVLTLTRAGRALHDGIVPQLLEREAQLLCVFGPEERTQFLDLLARLQEHARTLDGDLDRTADEEDA